MRAMAAKKDNRALGEVIGLVLIGAGTILFLSLLSYTPGDLPAWFFLSQTSHPHKPAHNFIGVVGAIIASLLYFLVGAGAYFVSVALIGYGGAKLVGAKVQFRRRALWVLVFIVTGACLLQIQPWFLQGWGRQMNLRSDGPAAGGLIGYWFGQCFLKQWLEFIGSGILLLCLYVTSIIMMTGLRPVHVLRSVLAMPGRIWERWMQFRIARADERQRLELEQQKLEREQRRIERELKKKQKELGRPAGLPDEPGPAPSIADLGDEPRPEPKIIDTAVAPAKSAANGAKKDKLTPKPEVHYENYQLPDVELLDPVDHSTRLAADPDELRAMQAVLIETLAQFGITATPGDITKGPTITRYELYPARGVRVDRISALERDLARATRAERINILAPVPGKDTVGVEIANSRKVTVTLRELLESEDWANTKAKIPLALGKDVYGNTIIADLAQMPHCLVAGTTGSGKSVCINSMIGSMLFRFTPEQLRLVMIDPKVVEMQHYNKLPHLVVPVVTDPKKVLLALRWVIDEMEKRYRIFAKCGVRNITAFNARPKLKSQAELDAEAAQKAEIQAILKASEPGAEEPPVIDFSEKSDDELFSDEPEPVPIRVPRDEEIVIPDSMPYIVVIVDELADLMQTAPADVESAIARITQMARAAGIHMIVATQTPRADIVTGIIKANIPSRIAFQVASKIDSRVILDENGAERLLGQGDMLYLPPGTSRMVRAQGVFVHDDEIHRLVDYAASQGEPAYEDEIHEKLQSTAAPEEDVSDEDEELVEKCIEIMRQEKKCSTSMLQRRLRLGYTRAARVVDILEKRGVVGPGEGAKPREILVDLDTMM
jgi:DNA segregation ATPase FtsK/SpoIIIE, S-DNA-T family